MIVYGFQNTNVSFISEGYYTIDGQLRLTGKHFEELSSVTDEWSGEVKTGWLGIVKTNAKIIGDTIEFTEHSDYHKLEQVTMSVDEFKKASSKVFEFENRCCEIGFWEAICEYCGYGPELLEL